MSQLYIRLMTSFYTHRKTAKLRSLIGDSALWIPPRIWAYCAENQPNGDLSKYSAEQLALLIGCSSNAQAMLQALKDSGFIDSDGFVHDWRDHNGYHESFSARARAAANARWNKKESPTPPKEDTGNRKEERGDKHCSSIACSISEVELPKEADTWNLLCGELPKVESVSSGRAKHLAQRRKEPYWVANFADAVVRISKSEFCNGKSDRGWKADFDFILKPDSVTKIMEGKYDNRDPNDGKMHRLREVIPIPILNKKPL